MNNRIVQIRSCVGKNGKKMTQEEFASRLNISRSFVNQVEVGAKNLSDRTILDICREFNVNEKWLKTGEGEMFLPEDRDDMLSRLTVDLLSEEEDSFKNRFVSLLARMTDEEWTMLENMVEKLSKKE